MIVEAKSTAPADTLTLKGLQTLLSVDFGETHFNAASNPLLYYQVTIILLFMNFFSVVCQVMAICQFCCSFVCSFIDVFQARKYFKDTVLCSVIDDIVNLLLLMTPFTHGVFYSPTFSLEDETNLFHRSVTARSRS